MEIPDLTQFEVLLQKNEAALLTYFLPSQIIPVFEVLIWQVDHIHFRNIFHHHSSRGCKVVTCQKGGGQKGFKQVFLVFYIFLKICNFSLTFCSTLQAANLLYAVVSTTTSVLIGSMHQRDMQIHTARFHSNFIQNIWSLISTDIFWKVLKTYVVGKGVVALLYNKKLIWRVSSHFI